MSGSLNKVTLIGRLGQNPEIKKSGNDGKIVTFSLATSDIWKDKVTGERKEKTEWHRIVIFNEHIGRIAEQYLAKGNQVYLEGELQTRKWSGNDGIDRYTTEVVLRQYRGVITLLGSKQEAMESAQQQSQQEQNQQTQQVTHSTTGLAVNMDNELNDDIPF